MTDTLFVVLLACVAMVAVAALMKAMDALDRLYFVELALRDKRPDVKECTCGCGRNVFTGSVKKAKPMRAVK